MLPGHGSPFRDGARRARTVASGKRRRLEEIRRLVAERDSTVTELTHTLFGTGADRRPTALRDGRDPRRPRVLRGPRACWSATAGRTVVYRWRSTDDSGGRRMSRATAPGRRGRRRIRRPVGHPCAGPRGRGNHRAGPHQPPPLPAAALPGRGRHPAARPDRAADPRGDQEAGQRTRLAGRGDRARPGRQGGPCRGSRRAPDRAALRLPDRRRRRHPFLLRPGRVRRVRSGDEDDRGRASPARPDPGRVRDGRARDRPAGAGRVVDVRADRCRPDRGRAGRTGRRAGAPGDAQGLPVGRHDGGAGSCWSRAPERCFRRSTRSCSATRTGGSSRWAWRSG